MTKRTVFWMLLWCAALCGGVSWLATTPTESQMTLKSGMRHVCAEGERQIGPGACYHIDGRKMYPCPADNPSGMGEWCEPAAVRNALEVWQEMIDKALK